MKLKKLDAARNYGILPRYRVWEKEAVLVNGYASRLSPACIAPSPVMVSTNLSGKMRGMPAVTSSCKNNPRCLSRIRAGVGVCAHCFADKGHSIHEQPRVNGVYNGELLSRELLPPDLLPRFINAQIARIESHGDVINVTHARNYVRMIRNNPDTFFGVWSKNPDFWAEAFKAEGGKPANMNFILSVCTLNADGEKLLEFALKNSRLWMQFLRPRSRTRRPEN